MKCIYCGEELKEGDLFCPKCGKGVQIVPDYNVYEDDYLKQVLESSAGDTAQKNAKAASVQKKQRQVILIVAVIVVVLVFALIVLGAAIRSNHANSFSYQLQQAKNAEAAGDYDKAIALYENALKLEPDGHADVLLALAALYEENGDTDKAIALYQDVLRADAKNRTACKALLALYEEQEDTQAILALSQSADESLQGLFAAYETSAPQLSLQSGTFEEKQTLQIVSAQQDTIYYTLDGSAPDTNGILYTGPIALEENNRTYTVKAVCQNEKGIYSEIVSAEYTIEIPAPDAPIVTPDGGDFGVETTVTVTVPDGCLAYYTWDGSTPTAGSSLYTQPLVIPEGNNVLSVILIDQETGLSSDVYRGNFIYYSEEEDGETDAETVQNP